MADYTSTVSGITPSMSGSMSVTGQGTSNVSVAYSTSSYANGTVSNISNGGNSLRFTFNLNDGSNGFYRFVGALANKKYAGTCVLNGSGGGAPIAADNWTADAQTGVGGKKRKSKAKVVAKAKPKTRAKAKPKAKAKKAKPKARAAAHGRR